MNAPARPRVLVVQDYFLPGYKGGGSLRSVANLVERLQDEYRFDVVSRDRDRGDRGRYPDLRPGWSESRGCRVRYLAPWQINPWSLRRVLADRRYDLVYFNSFFSRLTIWLLVARRFGTLPACPVVLAPRGELAGNALRLKRWRKAVYLRVCRRLGLWRDITWHVSSASERDEVSRVLGQPSEIALNLPSRPPPRGSLPELPEKRSGSARFVFLSRLVPKKNLETAIDLIGRVSGDVVFDVYGTAEDPGYVAECESRMKRLPPNVRCRYRGPVPHEEVHATLARYHVFFFPTLSENFGHVVLEALATGLPVLLSTETYWRDLERKGVGYDVPLTDPSAFVDRLGRFVAMGPEEFQRASAAATRLAEAVLSDPRPVEAHRRLFREALTPGHGRSDRVLPSVLRGHR
ncbi:MAG: glycosyltransferase family 4 protein [Thermoanaerobaculia bacterium]